MSKLTVKKYQDAVWDYIMEHCDITESGIYFVKFHTKNRKQFEGHIFNRVDGYHREDPISKEVAGVAISEMFKKDKQYKKNRYKREKEERKMKNAFKSKIEKSNKFIKPLLKFYGKNILKIQ